MDPVALRLAHDALIDEEKNKPFSSPPEGVPGGWRNEVWLVAQNTRGRLDAQGRPDPRLGRRRCIVGCGSRCQRSDVSFRRDGTVRIASGTQDIGTGTYTVLAQIVSDKTGVPIEKIEVVLGDSSLPPDDVGWIDGDRNRAPLRCGRRQCCCKSAAGDGGASTGSPYLHKDAATLALTAGRVHAKASRQRAAWRSRRSSAWQTSPAQTEMASQAGLVRIRRLATIRRTPSACSSSKVEWDPGIAKLRVSRVVSVMDGGRILNKKTATNRSQEPW